MKTGFIAIAWLLAFSVGCAAPAQVSESTATPPPSSSQTSSVPVTSSSFSQPEQAVRWESVHASRPSPMNRDVSEWEQTIVDADITRQLWQIVADAQSTPPREYQSAPDGGTPLILEFTSPTETKSVHIRIEGGINVDDVWYGDTAKEAKAVAGLVEYDEWVQYFTDRYHDGLFGIELVDCNDTPVINATVKVNLGWEQDRTLITDSNGWARLPLPHDETTAFINGTYQFEITQASPDNTVAPEVISATLDEWTSYPRHRIKLSSESTAAQLESYKDKLSLQILYKARDKMRGLHNMWVELSPQGVSTPDSGTKKNGAYTVGDGKVYFPNVTAGQYVVGVYDRDRVQLMSFDLSLEGTTGQSVMTTKEGYEIKIDYSIKE